MRLPVDEADYSFSMSENLFDRTGVEQVPMLARDLVCRMYKPLKQHRNQPVIARVKGHGGRLRANPGTR